MKAEFHGKRTSRFSSLFFLWKQQKFDNKLFFLLLFFYKVVMRTPKVSDIRSDKHLFTK